MSQSAEILAFNSNKETDTLHKYLCFLLGPKVYGVNILRVKELVEYTEITPIPMMPDFFWGAVNLRGGVVPIIDLSKRLGMESSKLSRRTCFVIVEVEINGTVIDAGIVADAVSQVADIPPECREPTPNFGGNIDNIYFEGIGKVDEKFVMLLNIDSVMSMVDLAGMQQAGKIQVSPEAGTVEHSESQPEPSNKP